MKVVVFSTKSYDREFLSIANNQQHDMTWLEAKLTEETVSLAEGFPVVCVFVNDRLNEHVLRKLHQQGTRLIALRSAGFNHVDIRCAEQLGLVVARVPAYSPHAVAEHALALILSLNRKTYRAFNRVREANFSLEGLLGFDMVGKCVGVIGTGKIGAIFAVIMNAMGCKVIAYDPSPDPGITHCVRYVDLQKLYAEADIISLHCPLVPETQHLINEASLSRMKDGVMLINTSRGLIVDTRAAIQSLKNGKIAYLGLDVYEEEGDFFFDDLSQAIIKDDVFMRLLTFPNVLITSHQGFFTREAMTAIAKTTVENISAFESGAGNLNKVTSELAS